MRIKNSVPLVVVSTLLSQSFARCPEHYRKCDTLAEPPHLRDEIPTDGDRVIVVNSMAVSGSNVSAVAIHGTTKA